MNNYGDTNMKMGVAGGTLMALIANINAADILRTILLAAMGAIVSFGMSLLMKQVVKWNRQNRDKR
jgi:mannitol-specific phosphotransferase system IIBC component